MLFTDDNLKLLSPPPAAVIESPAGLIAFDVKLDDMSLAVEPCNAYHFCEGGTLYHWSLAQAEVELLLCPNPVELSEMYEISHVLSAFVRVQARDGNLEVGFSATLDDITDGFSGGTDSGQAFCSLAWSNGPMSVSLGTQDEEGLQARCGRDLPHRWSPDFEECGDYVTCDGKHHIVIETPPLQPLERCQLGYALAWKESADEDGVAAWYASDVGNRPNRKDIKPTPRGWANGASVK